jgi:hypothetical protein
MTPSINPALDSEALYGKSQVYIQRGLRSKGAGDAEEYQLWASLSLELLGKAALAGLHPSLVADPLHTHSMFAACGRQLSSDIKTITAKTLFDRLGHLDKAFDARDQKFCEQMALRRNAELHSGESPFSATKRAPWEKQFWGAVQIVLNMQDKSLDSWLGAESAKAPKQIVEDAAEALRLAVESRVERCRDAFEDKYPKKKRANTITESEGMRWWELPRRFHVVADAHDRTKCPACGSKGVVAGIRWSEELSTEQDKEDPSVEYVDIVYLAEEFDCPICDLHLFGRKEIEAAELSDEFTKIEVREREFEAEYGND